MSSLIFDVGFHRGEDTREYLLQGYRVVAVDADPRNIEWAKNEFQNAIQSGQLTLVNAAASDVDGQAEFYLSKSTVWSSLKSGIAGRLGRNDHPIQVATKRLDGLFSTYGVPYYCKIDVEGYDHVCLQTLQGMSKLPQFISVESECLAEGETASSEIYLRTLRGLEALGYNRFKLVDQASLSVLDDQVIYDDSPIGWIAHIRQLLKRGYDSQFSRIKRSSQQQLRMRLNRERDYAFGATGPFGDQLGGEWSDAATALRRLELHRRAFFQMRSARSFGFWCDWHATRMD